MIFILVGIFLLILALLFNLAVAKTDTSKPLSKASEGGDMDVLWERGDITQSEVRLVSGKHVLIGLVMSWGQVKSWGQACYIAICVIALGHGSKTQDPLPRSALSRRLEGQCQSDDFLRRYRPDPVLPVAPRGN